MPDSRRGTINQGGDRGRIVNGHRAHRSLRAAFPDWPATLAAPDEALANAIRSGGLAQLKARRIKEVLARVLAERGDFDLNFLADLPLPEAGAWLVGLPSVVPKLFRGYGRTIVAIEKIQEERATRVDRMVASTSTPAS